MSRRKKDRLRPLTELEGTGKLLLTPGARLRRVGPRSQGNAGLSY